MGHGKEIWPRFQSQVTSIVWPAVAPPFALRGVKPCPKQVAVNGYDVVRKLLG
jgi:hypothetical protein